MESEKILEELESIKKDVMEIKAEMDEKKAKEQKEKARLKEIMSRGKFKDGDYVATKHGNIFIYKCMDKGNLVGYVFLGRGAAGYYDLSIYPACSYDDSPTLATPEQVKKLDNFLASKGKRWNSQTKKLEDLVFEPKEGDIVANKYGSVFIFKGENRYGACDYYVGVYKDIFYTQNNTGFNKSNLRPATYEERCKFFERLVKEGYKWDSKKLKLTKRGLKPEDMRNGGFYKINLNNGDKWLIRFDRIGMGRLYIYNTVCLNQCANFSNGCLCYTREIGEILPATPEEIKKLNTTARWRAKSGDVYSFISECLGEFTIKGDLEQGHDVDDSRFKSGNYFNPGTGDAARVLNKIKSVFKEDYDI